MARLYTSRFSNKELETGNYMVISIARSMPRFPVKYRIAGTIVQLAPPGFLWNENDIEKFKEPYFKHVEKAGYPLIGGLIRAYLDMGKDVVLCCYEDVRKPNEWCHRLVFAEWWNEKTGWVIEELTDPSSTPADKSKRVTREEKEPYEQLSFMSDLNKAMYPHYTT